LQRALSLTKNRPSHLIQKHWIPGEEEAGL
jgi:hypothetical protein